jgi:crotonobetainyl-CoA:carnitine CoA-transferase CaiB-like acyl-CoA transferase
MGALDGLKVVDLSRLLPGPFCTAMLADHGADVIVVEGPRFRDDPVLGNVPMVRRNKRHIALDLRGAPGKDIFFKLAKNADVVIEGFRPGVAGKLGVDYSAVRSVNPGVIYCSLTGYGQTGPLRDRAGHDLNYMALAGMLDLNRDKDGLPLMPNFQMADLAGSLYAAVGILMALASRKKTGNGQYVDVSMTDSLVSLLAVPLSFISSGKTLPGRPDNDAPEWHPCYQVYKTRDGEYLSVGPLEPHLWQDLCLKLGCPEYGPAQYDPSKREEIEARLTAIFAANDLDEWLSRLNDPNDCVAPVTRVTALGDVPHFRSRDMVRTDGDGIPQPGVTPLLSGTPGSIRRPPYEFGEHGREIVKEIGYSDDECEALIKEGILWLPNSV